jgi:hypothetical protein
MLTVNRVSILVIISSMVAVSFALRKRCTISRKIESCWFSVYHAIVSSCWNYHQMLLLSLRIIDQTLFHLTADNYVTHFTHPSPALNGLLTFGTSIRYEYLFLCR